MATKKLTNFIDGKQTAPLSATYFENISPATNQVISFIPDSDQRDVELAVAAAKRAFPKWSALSVCERCQYMFKIAAEMKKQVRHLCECEANDMGKPLSMSTNFDLPGAIDHFEYFAKHMCVSTTPYYQHKEAVAMEHRNAIGVVGCISPWNFPIYLFCSKVAPAIACGNTVVIKPSEISPSTAYEMSLIFQKIGLPNGVVNVVHGYGPSAGQPIVGHPDVRAISFTGGSVTGSKISAIAAPKLKKLQLELGGKNSAIVFADCYLQEALENIAYGSMLNTGQVCCSSSKVLVERKFLDKFAAAFKKHVMETWASNIGDPLKETTMMGPLVSAQHFKKVASYVELAKKEGGKVILGGRDMRSELPAPLNKGNFFTPTIVVDLEHNSRCGLEEIFGPVVTIHPFDSEEEAVKIANEVQYGLAACVFTGDSKRGFRVARQLESGSVWINCWGSPDPRLPFGGFKNSGVNREGGRHSIDFFSEIKSIVSKL